MFNFTMNGIIWVIKEVRQETFWEDDHEEFKDDGSYFFGRCKVNNNEIWIWKDIVSMQQKRTTLYHELIHAYLFSYLTFNNIEYDTDTWCDISANSHDMIHDIVDRYFKARDNLLEE